MSTTMRVGIIQSSFFPWRGYFDFISSVDVFVLYDDVQYSKGDWRNRNQLKTQSGLRWFTVPLLHAPLGTNIDQMQIDAKSDWVDSHAQLLRSAYRQAPYLAMALELLPARGHFTMLSALNMSLIRNVCEVLQIRTPIVQSSTLGFSNERRTERLISILKSLGATHYLSGPSADAYLDKSKFADAGIRLEYKSYDYASYPQLWGDFVGGVSILDLLANVGPDSKNHLRSRSPDALII